MNNILLMTVGTNAKSYISRFQKFAKNNGKITYFKISPNQIELFLDEVLVDNFTSQATINQFLRTLEAFGFIEKGTGFYLIIQKEMNIYKMTDSIFKYSNDRKVKIMRQTRIISLLLYMNSITKDDFEEMGFKGIKGKPKYLNILKETSSWEKEILKDTKILINVLERLEKYEFTKN